VHPAFDRKGIARHRTSDGKKRVALQDEYDKNGREAKTRTPRSRGPTAPIDTVTTADLPGPFVSTTRLNQTSGLRVPPSFIAGPESVMMPDWDLPPLCTFCQRFLRQLTEKVSDCNVTFLNPGGACRCNRNDDIGFRGKEATILATQAYGL